MKKASIVAIILVAAMVAISMSGCLNGNSEASSAYSSLALSFDSIVSDNPSVNFTVEAPAYAQYGWSNQKNASVLLNLFNDYDVNHQISVQVVAGATSALDAANAKLEDMKTDVYLYPDAQIITETPVEGTIGSENYPGYMIEAIYSPVTPQHYHFFYLEYNGSVVVICEQYIVTIAERDRSESLDILSSIVIKNSAY